VGFYYDARWYKCHKGATDQQKRDHNKLCESCARGQTKVTVIEQNGKKRTIKIKACPAHGDPLIPPSERQAAPEKVPKPKKGD